jgi:molybdopterin-guanine dinucleotide biosynthesis protein A
MVHNDVKGAGKLKTTGIILAGGKSSRMGRDKSLLDYNNEPLIKQVVKELQQVTDELIIVSNQNAKYDFPGTREISDIYPGMGPLGGIHSGLTFSAFDYAFVTACDLPFFDGRLARFLLERREGFDVVVPQIGSYLQPLFAVYSKRCLPHAEFCLKQNIRKVVAIYPMVKVNYVGENLIRSIIDPEKVFFNVNTPKDYAEIKKK